MATKKFCDVCDCEIKSSVEPTRVDLRFNRPGNNYATVKLVLQCGNYTAMDLCLRCIIKEMQKQLREHDPQPKDSRVFVRDEEER